MLNDESIRILNQAYQYVFSLFASESSGHDYWHAFRTAQIAKRLAKGFDCDLFVIELSAILHDIDDPKVNSDKTQTNYLHTFFEQASVLPDVRERIANIIKYITLETSIRDYNDIEGMIVQDADNIDALGAIGIARLFSFGGKNGKIIVNDNDFFDFDTSLGHFYSRLSTLPNNMNTLKAKRYAKRRMRFMKKFVREMSFEIKNNM